MSLSVRDLSFAYSKKQVLHEIDIQPLAAGTVTALIGPNATGKSTFFKCIAGLHKPQSGQIILDDQEQGQVSRQLWSRRVCFMPQSYVCQAALSVFDVVLLARKQLQGWRARDEDIHAVATILRALNIEHLSQRDIGDLSGGQQQMVSMAQALVRSPRLFLLDEPTSALDLRHQLEIMTAIRHETRQRNIVTIVALHDLNLAARFADQLVLLREGRVLAQGSAMDILSSENIGSTYGVDVEVHTTSGGLISVVASL